MAERTTRKQRRGIAALANLSPKQHGSFAQIQPQKATTAAQPLAKLSDKVKPRLADSWIADAYTYADEIGEVGFVVNLQANLGSRCHWVPQEFDVQTGDWIDSENEAVLKAMSAFQGPHGGQMELRRRAFLHMAIAGESLLLASPTDEPDVATGVVWEFLSSQEIKVGMNEKAIRYRDGRGLAGEPIDQAETYLARCWRSHPEFSSLSDSPLRRCLTIANEILYLTRSIAASVRSRLAAGIVFVPDEADFTASNQEDEDLVDAETDAVDGMERAQLRSVDELGLIIAKHLRAPIEDPLAPGSIIPLVISLKKELIDFIKLFDLAKAIDPQTQDLLAKALERLPRALDVDPGILDGKAQSTHWNGWLIDDDLVQKHVIPAGELIVEFVTVAYLRPALVTFFGMTDQQARLFKLVLDPSPIQARSDAAVSARVLFEEGVLKVETLLRANGFDPSDAPDDQEWIRQFARKMLLRSPALGPVLGVTAGLPDLDWSAAIPATGAGGPLASSPVSVAGAPTKKIAPTSETSGLGRPTGASVEAQSFTTLMTQVATAADAAIFRAFELAGARFASHAKKDAGLRTRIAGIDRGQVLTAVAPSDLVQLGVTHEVLFDGAWKALNQNVRCWVRDYEQNARGVESLIADDLGAVAAGNLCDALTLFVLDHRHSPIGRQRNGLAIPDELVLEALHGAGVM